MALAMRDHSKQRTPPVVSHTRTTWYHACLLCEIVVSITSSTACNDDGCPEYSTRCQPISGVWSDRAMSFRKKYVLRLRNCSDTCHPHSESTWRHVTAVNVMTTKCHFLFIIVQIQKVLFSYVSFRYEGDECNCVVSQLNFNNITTKHNQIRAQFSTYSSV